MKETILSEYSDIDIRGNVKIGAVIDLLQDVSTAHSSSVGYTLEKFSELSLGMILYSWRI